MSQIQLLRNSDQVPLANQMGTQFGELSLAKIGQPLKQLLTGNQAENRVPKKLQLLVVPHPDEDFRCTHSLSLPRIGSVCESQFN